MKKKIILTLFLIVFFILPFMAKAGVDEAVNYLKAQPQDAWITQALVAAGETSVATDHLTSVNPGALNPANDYAKAILALTAAGKNPTTFGSEDYVAKLKTYYDGEQMGEVSLINDDIWAILALASVGQVDSEEAQAAKNYLLANQNEDGGWGYSPGGASDTNDTAAVIIALVEAGVSASNTVIVNAINYLQSTQNDDGGFTYDPNSEFGTDSDSGSDAWVICALNKIGQDPTSWDKEGNNSITHLESLQDEDDGGYWWVEVGTSQWNNKAMTAYAIIALSGKSFPIGYYEIPLPVSVPTAHLVIKGKAGVICEADIKANTALEIVENGAETCNYTYNIEDTDFGPYLNKINNDAAEGSLGWLYYVNSVMPDVGAFDYDLSEGDEVLWYFGEWGWDNITLAEGGASEVAVIVSQPLTIAIPSTVNDATINVSSLVTDDGTNTIATLPKITLNAVISISGSAVEVVIPDGAVITAPTGWNGIINAPRIEENSSVTVTPDSGYTAEVSSVIEVGYGDIELLFDKAVRLLIPGAAGKKAGYSRGSNFTAISEICGADNQETGNALAEGDECKIDIGSDLVVWTKHFTRFVTYLQSIIQNSPPPSTIYNTPSYNPPSTNSINTATSTDEQIDFCQEDCLSDSQEPDTATSTEDIKDNPDEILPEVLGTKIIAKEGEDAEEIESLSEASIIVSGDVNKVVAQMNLKRDLSLEKDFSKTIVAKVIKGKELTAEKKNSITNFITYGTKTTDKLGAGERAGVINSYKFTFGKLPEKEEDWEDVIKIAKGEMPNKENASAEDEAKNTFKKVYGREVDRANSYDNLAIKMITYGLRPVKRDLEKEKSGIKIFQDIYGQNPISAIDWDIVRAISYSGAVR
ncbi:MAG: DUF4430 domain-containing protein [Patescibacteria group bacterium]